MYVSSQSYFRITGLNGGQGLCRSLSWTYPTRKSSCHSSFLQVQYMTHQFDFYVPQKQGPQFNFHCTIIYARQFHNVDIEISKTKQGLSFSSLILVILSKLLHSKYDCIEVVHEQPQAYDTEGTVEMHPGELIHKISRSKMCFSF